MYFDIGKPVSDEQHKRLKWREAEGDTTNTTLCSPSGITTIYYDPRRKSRKVKSEMKDGHCPLPMRPPPAELYYYYWFRLNGMTSKYNYRSKGVRQGNLKVPRQEFHQHSGSNSHLRAHRASNIVSSHGHEEQTTIQQQQSILPYCKCSGRSTEQQCTSCECAIRANFKASEDAQNERTATKEQNRKLPHCTTKVLGDPLRHLGPPFPPVQVGKAKSYRPGVCRELP